MIQSVLQGLLPAQSYSTRPRAAGESTGIPLKGRSGAGVPGVDPAVGFESLTEYEVVWLTVVGLARTNKSPVIQDPAL